MRQCQDGVEQGRDKLTTTTYGTPCERGQRGQRLPERNVGTGTRNVFDMDVSCLDDDRYALFHSDCNYGNGGSVARL